MQLHHGIHCSETHNGEDSHHFLVPQIFLSKEEAKSISGASAVMMQWNLVAASEEYQPRPVCRQEGRDHSDEEVKKLVLECCHILKVANEQVPKSYAVLSILPLSTRTILGLYVPQNHDGICDDKY